MKQTRRITSQPRGWTACLWPALIAGLLVTAASSLTLAADPSSTAVGMPRKLTQLVIPGPLLRPKPLVRGQPVVLRIIAEYPHGDANRYDFEYTLLEPGRFDLRDYLQREDGSAMDTVPSIPVEAVTALPDGQILPNELHAGPLPGWGGYRAVLLAASILWGLGLLFLLVPRRKGRLAGKVETATKSLETRLHEAIQAAEAGTLSPADRAELERMVLAHWRQRLGLTHLPAAEALSAIRQNEQASAALNLLEQWLHHPQRRNIEDFAALLDPAREDGRVPRVH